MSLEIEAVLDRRRLRRKLGIWRSLALISLLGVFTVILSFTAGDKGLIGQLQIARVTISGVITENRQQLRMLRMIAEADHVKGVIVAINSPGGTTTGAEALIEEIRTIAKNKPVVAQFGTIAASAAYATGLACDHIIARGNTITGSVGVIMQWPEFSGLLEKAGVKINEIKSGLLKAEPSAFKPISPEAREVSMEMIANSQRWFINLVERRRKITADDIPGLRDGRVYLGRTALKYNLIDELGGENKAVAWMIENRNIPDNIKIVDWRSDNQLDWRLTTGSTLGYLTQLFIKTFYFFSTSLVSEHQIDAIALDGLVSVWKPGAS
ncbi:MAG: hypothetical protein TECD_00999 [Hyphomicrobiaceae bacterium hypho_1]